MEGLNLQRMGFMVKESRSTRAILWNWDLLSLEVEQWRDSICKEWASWSKKAEAPEQFFGTGTSFLWKLSNGGTQFAKNGLHGQRKQKHQSNSLELGPPFFGS